MNYESLSVVGECGGYAIIGVGFHPRAVPVVVITRYGCCYLDTLCVIYGGPNLGVLVGNCEGSLWGVGS